MKFWLGANGNDDDDYVALTKNRCICMECNMHIFLNGFICMCVDCLSGLPFTGRQRMP